MIIKNKKGVNVFIWVIFNIKYTFRRNLSSETYHSD